MCVVVLLHGVANTVYRNTLSKITARHGLLLKYNVFCDAMHCNVLYAGVLTGAGHGRRVCFRAEESLVTDAGGGSLPDGVAVERTLGAGAVRGQSAVVPDLTG